MSTSGDFCFMETNKVQSCFWALGPITFWKKKDIPPKKMLKITTEAMMRNNGIPAAFMDNNS